MSTEVEQAVVVEATEPVVATSETEVVAESTNDAPVLNEAAASGTESSAEPTVEASKEQNQNQAQSQDQDDEQKQASKRKRRRRKRGNRKGRPLDAFQPGDELEGVVRSVQPYGAFIDVGAERDGLIHISELRDGFVEKVEDVIKEGDKVTVRVKEVQVEQGRLSLTMRNPDSEKQGPREPKKKRLRLKELNEDDEFTGSVSSIVDFGAFVDIGAVTDGLVHISEISEDRVNNVSDHLQEGQEVKVRILGVDKKRKRISLTMREKPAIEDKYLRTSSENHDRFASNNNQSQNRNGHSNSNGKRQKQNHHNEINFGSDTDELPSMMQLAFARAQARKSERSKKKQQNEDNSLDDIITRMLADQ